MGESPFLFHRGADRNAHRGAAGDRSDDGDRHPDPDHLRDERDDGDHHAGRDLLRGDVRGIDHIDPDQPARGVRLGDDHAGRLSNGQKGKAGTGAGDGRPGVIHRGNFCHHYADVDCAPLGELCRIIRTAGVFCPDVHGTHAGLGIGRRCAPEGVYQRGPGTPGRLRRHRRHQRGGPVHLRQHVPA